MMGAREMGATAGVVAVIMVITIFGLKPWWPVHAWHQWFRVLYFTVIFVQLAVFLRLFVGSYTEELNLSNVIYAVTGFILLWYTLETYALRWQTVEQTSQMSRQTEQIRAQRELQIRPVVLVVYGDNAPGVRNIGNGAALGVRIEAIRIGAPEQPAEIRFDPIDILTAGESRTLITHTLVNGKERAWNFLAAHLNPDPKIAPRPYDATLRYQDIEGRGYESRVRFGPGEYRLLDTRRTDD